MFKYSQILSRRVLAFGLVVATLAGCGAMKPSASSVSTTALVPDAATAVTGKLIVVATFSVLGDLVQNVTGDIVDLTTLVPPGGDPHTFDPSPTDSVTLARADLIFENGLEYEAWLPDLVRAARSKAQRVVVTEGIEAIVADEEAHGERAEDTATEVEYDPHVWHDVKNVISMVEHIRDALVASDPAHAAAYQTNADAYLHQLMLLDVSIIERVSSLPGERRKLVTTHDTFGYFARRYSFEIVGTTLGSVSTEVSDPSAADIAALVDQIKATGVPAIFTENIGNGSLTERIAQEADVALAPVLYTDALGEPGSAGTTYVQMMRYNVDTIVTALSR